MGAKTSKQTAKPTKKDIYEEQELEHDGAVNCMTLSEDSSLLITGSEDGTARMWSTKTLDTECLGVLEGHTGYITCVASCDTFVLTGSADHTLKKWDMTTCQCVFTYQGHESRINRLICTGEFVFSSSYDRTVRAWLFDTSELDERGDSPDKACVRVFKGHQNAVYPIIFIPCLDSGSQDSQDDVVELVQGKFRAGDILLSGSTDRTIKSWKLHNEAVCHKTFRGHSGPVSCMATDHTGQILVSGGPDGTVKLWDINTALCKKTIIAHGQSIICMQMVDKLLYTGSSDCTVKAWVVEFAEGTRTFNGHQHSVICLKVANGSVFTGCGDTLARAFDAKSGALRRVYRGHSGAITCLQYVDKKLYTGSTDGTLRVWNADKIVSEDKYSSNAELVSSDSESEHEEFNYFDEQEKRIRELERRLRSVDHSVDLKKFQAQMEQITEQMNEDR